MHINVKMSTIIVDTLTFISMLNSASERLKAKNVFIFQHFSFYELLKFHAQLEIRFITSGSGLSRACAHVRAFAARIHKERI